MEKEYIKISDDRYMLKNSQSLIYSKAEIKKEERKNVKLKSKSKTK